MQKTKLKVHLESTAIEATGVTESRIMKAVNSAYEYGELNIDQDLPSGERGDGLADFLATELREVMEGAETPDEALSAAIRAVEVAACQLADVKAALFNLA